MGEIRTVVERKRLDVASMGKALKDKNSFALGGGKAFKKIRTKGGGW